MSDDLGLSWFIRFKIDRTIRKNIGMPRSLRIYIDSLWISDLPCGLPDSYANCLIERAGIGNLPIYRFTATSKRKQNSFQRERNLLDPQDPLGFTLSHQRFGGFGPEVVGAPNHESVLCSEISRGRKVYCHLLPTLAISCHFLQLIIFIIFILVLSMIFKASGWQRSNVFSIASANACILHVSIQSWGRLWIVASAFSGDASDSAERRPPRWNLNAAWSSKLMSDDLGLSWFIRFKIDRTVSKNIGKPQLINQPLELQCYTRHVLSLLWSGGFCMLFYVLIFKEYDVRSLRIEILWISDLPCGLPDSYANCLIERAGIGNLPIYRFTATSKRKQNSFQRERY